VGCGGRGGDGSEKGIFWVWRGCCSCYGGVFWGGGVVGWVGGWVGGAWRIWFGEDTVVTREREKHVKKITPEICVFDDKEIVWMCRGGETKGIMGLQ